jgi:O-antigen/teichoic acid export membrane protein
MNLTHFSRTTAATLGSEIVIHLMTFATTVLIVRMVSSRDFGIFTLLVTFALSLCYLTSFGIPQSCVYFIARGTHPAQRVLSINCTFYWAVGLLCCAVFYVFKQLPLATFLQDLPAPYLPGLLCLYVLFLMQSLFLAYFRGIHAFGVYNVLRGLPALFILLILSAAAAVGKVALLTVVAVFLAIHFLAVLLMWYWAARSAHFSLCFDLRTMKNFLAYGLKSYAQILSGHMMYHLDIYIIAYLLGAQQVAYYSIAVALAAIVWYVPDTAGVVLLPLLAQSTSDEDVYSFSALVCRTIVFMTFLGACAVGVVGRPLMQVFYGAEYLEGFPALLLILPGIVMMSIYKILTRTFSSRDRQQVSIWVALIALLINVGLNILLIPRYGIEGAAVASSIAYGVAGIVLAGKLARESGLPLKGFLLVTREDIAAYRGVIARSWKRISSQRA